MQEFEGETRAAMKALGPAEGFIDVVVQKALHLPRMDTFGSCDGLTRLKYHNKTYDTDVRKNTFSPVWNQEIRLNVHEVAKAGSFPLEIMVFDWNASGEEDLVGLASIPAEEISSMFEGTLGATKKHKLHLKDAEGQDVVGHDKQRTEIHLTTQPFKRFMMTQAYADWEKFRDLEFSNKQVVNDAGRTAEGKHIRARARTHTHTHNHIQSHTQAGCKQDGTRADPGGEVQRLRPEEGADQPGVEDPLLCPAGGWHVLILRHRGRLRAAQGEEG